MDDSSPALRRLLENNRRWAAEITARDPEFFRTLSHQQAPKYLWIGCADSRVPANEIVGLLPGELFVHRNVANQVMLDDVNCQSALDYSVNVLKVAHVIVCGHYGCGGVTMVAERQPAGRLTVWLDHLSRLRDEHEVALAALPAGQRAERLCELNVIAQVRTVCESPAVQEAWGRGQVLAVHGWIYRVSDGRLRDFGLCVTSPQEKDPACAAA